MANKNEIPINYGNLSRFYQNLKNSLPSKDNLKSLGATITPSNDYLNFSSNLANAKIKLSVEVNTETPNFDIDYSFDRINWQPYTVGEDIVIPNAGDKVYLRGNNDCFYKYDYDEDDEAYASKFVFSTTSSGTFKIYANGNINSLLSKTNYNNIVSLKEECYNGIFRDCTNLTTAPALPATTLAYACYCSMFHGCSSLTTVPELPATELARECYSGMFNGCSSLTTAPELPATTLVQGCYIGMFAECTSLTTAPVLPATALTNNCYDGMFRGCTSLTTAPELPATTLTDTCYHSMFVDCTSLTTAPALPATTLERDCYYYMFHGCSSLTTVPELPATTLKSRCYQNMFEDCSSLTTAPELPATTLVDGCYQSMFRNCTSLTTAPELPATTLARACYYGMFDGCSSLNHIKCLAINGINQNGSTTNWVSGVAGSGTFVKAANMTGWTTGSNGIPSGWTVEDYVEPIEIDYIKSITNIDTLPDAEEHKDSVLRLNGDKKVYLSKYNSNNAPDSEQVGVAYITDDVSDKKYYTGTEVTIIASNGTFTGYAWYYESGQSTVWNISEVSVVKAEEILNDSALFYDRVDLGDIHLVSGTTYIFGDNSEHLAPITTRPMSDMDMSGGYYIKPVGYEWKRVVTEDELDSLEARIYALEHPTTTE